MNCKKHAKEVPMIAVSIDFVGHKVVVGHYCLLCYSFVPIADPELQVLRDLLIKNMNSDTLMLSSEV